MHDVHRLIQNSTGEYCSPKDSLPAVREILERINFPQDKLDMVLHAIEYHEVYNFNKSQENVSDIESLILQDADNLDAIGAIGISRAIIYNTAHNLPMYDPSIPFADGDEYKDDMISDPSLLHHVKRKLINTGKHMNTVSAMELAKDKVLLMEQFVEDYLNSLNGTYKKEEQSVNLQ